MRVRAVTPDPLQAGALARIRAPGIVTVTPAGVAFAGFDIPDAGSDREAAILAMAWAMRELQREVIAAIEHPHAHGATRHGIAPAAGACAPAAPAAPAPAAQRPMPPAPDVWTW